MPRRIYFSPCTASLNCYKSVKTELQIDNNNNKPLGLMSIYLNMPVAHSLMPFFLCSYFMLRNTWSSSFIAIWNAFGTPSFVNEMNIEHLP